MSIIGNALKASSVTEALEILLARVIDWQVRHESIGGSAQMDVENENS